MAHKCKVFETVSLTLHMNCAHVFTFKSYWHTCRKQNMSVKQGIHKIGIDDEE